MPEPTRHRVLIAGGGVAGLEALIALHHFAAHRLELTLLAPDADFTIRALSVQEPFARPASHHYDVARICADHDATFVQDALAAVDGETRTVTTAGGERRGYDSLIVAIGARPVPAFERVATFRGAQDAEAVHGLVQDVEGGYSRRIAFVVPSGVTWPLPLYELALMTAERASSLGVDVELTFVTPEERPLGLFGTSASEAVAEAMRTAGIDVRTSTHVAAIDHGTILGPSQQTVVEAQRVIALPRLTATAIPGLPADADGFLRIDDHGRVPGVDGVYAAGDGTTFPVKQGGIAAQQADVAARAIAEAAGAGVLTQPFQPTLRAKLLTGAQATYLRHAIAGGAGEQASKAADRSLWWPPAKVAAPYLSPYLERLDGDRAAIWRG